MKKQILLLSILATIMALVTTTTFITGEKHVLVVEENQVLVHKSDSLTTENKRLCQENTTLKNENTKLCTLIHLDSLSLSEDSLKKKESESQYKKALVSLEKLVLEDLTWISPESAYETLAEKLNRKPTAEEFQNTLEDLFQKNLLYHYIAPDPYMKGKKVKQTEIAILVKKIIN